MDNIREHRQARHQIVLLRDKADPGAQPSDFAALQPADLAAENGDCSGCRRDEAQQAFQERRLAGAVGSDQCHGLATANRKADFGEYRRVLSVARRELVHGNIDIPPFDRQAGDESRRGKRHSPTNSENCG